MTDKNEDKQHKALTKALEKIQAPIAALALFKLADEFYTKEERTQLYGEYQKLRDADTAAYEVLTQITASDDRAAHMAAFEAKQAASEAVTAFEKQHRLVMRLMDARDKFGKGRHE
jgi:hypothetical protein